MKPAEDPIGYLRGMWVKYARQTVETFYQSGQTIPPEQSASKFTQDAVNHGFQRDWVQSVLSEVSADPTERFRILTVLYKECYPNMDLFAQRAYWVSAIEVTLLDRNIKPILLEELAGTSPVGSTQFRALEPVPHVSRPASPATTTGLRTPSPATTTGLRGAAPAATTTGLRGAAPAAPVSPSMQHGLTTYESASALHPQNHPFDGSALSRPETNTIPEFIETKPSPSTSSRTLERKERIDLIGLAIAEGYLRTRKIEIEYIAEESSDEPPRHDSFMFRKKAAEVSFATLARDLDDVLSFAGYEPEDVGEQIEFFARKDNKFQLFIPRPQSEWREILLFDVITDDRSRAIGTDYKNPNRINDLFHYLRKKANISMADRLALPFMVDMYGRPFDLDLTANCIIAGSSGGGKSSSLHNLLCTGMVLYGYHQLKFALLDFQNGVTFDKYAGLKYVWQGHIVTEPKDAIDWFKELRSEYESRLDILTRNGFEDIRQFNSAKIRAGRDEECMSWLPVFFEEIGAFKMGLGDKSNEIIDEITQRWRKAGMPMGGAIQYGTRDQGIGPSARQNINSMVSFRSDENAAKILFGGSSKWNERARYLMGPGACIVFQGGRYTQGQTLYLADERRKTLLQYFHEVYGEGAPPMISHGNGGGHSLSAEDVVFGLLNESHGVSTDNPNRQLHSVATGQSDERLENAIWMVLEAKDRNPTKVSIRALMKILHGSTGGQDYNKRSKLIKDYLIKAYKTEDPEVAAQIVLAQRVRAS